MTVMHHARRSPRWWRVPLCALALAGAAAGPALPATPGDPLVVSVTFDDGLARAFPAGDLLHARDMNGTFYVSSGRLGADRYLTWDQVQALAAAGNEIGGRTIDHMSLPALTTDQQRVEVCNDRAALAAHGLTVTDLAYPNGASTAAVEDVARGCGYTSARAETGLGCAGCVVAEPLPAADPYAIRALPVLSDPALRRVQTLVSAAEPAGGWVNLVFHQLCSSTTDAACTDGVTPTTFAQLLDWLGVERSAGRLVVRTVAQVTGGPAQPVVTVPSTPLTALFNPGLTLGDGTLPACWIPAGSGDGRVQYARLDGGGVRMTVSGTLSTAGWKLTSSMDTGLCAPVAQAGQVATVGLDYRSSDGPRPLVYVRTGAQQWRSLGVGPALPAATSTTHATWRTPVLPEGTTAIAVGITMDHDGTTDLLGMSVDGAIPGTASTPAGTGPDPTPGGGPAPAPVPAPAFHPTWLARGVAVAAPRLRARFVPGGVAVDATPPRGTRRLALYRVAADGGLTRVATTHRGALRAVCAGAPQCTYRVVALNRRGGTSTPSRQLIVADRGILRLRMPRARLR
ncbi:MAG: polysaccharide deacetylase family protein [Thermoleophilia bacterium]